MISRLSDPEHSQKLPLINTIFSFLPLKQISIHCKKIQLKQARRKSWQRSHQPHTNWDNIGLVSSQKEVFKHFEKKCLIEQWVEILRQEYLRTVVISVPPALLWMWDESHKKYLVEAPLDFLDILRRIKGSRNWQSWISTALAHLWVSYVP